MFNGSLAGQIVSNPVYQKSDFAGGSNSSPDQNSDFIEPIEFSNRMKSRLIRREDIYLDKIENNWSHELNLEEVGHGNFSVVYKGTINNFFVVILLMCKQFAIQLASNVYQYKACKFQGCYYDKVLLAMISTKDVPNGTSIENTLETLELLSHSFTGHDWHKIVEYE